MAFIDRSKGRRIYFEDHPGEGMPILLVHAWAMSTQVWDTTVAYLLDRGHRVVTFDQRGCGRSDKDFDDFSISASASDAEAIAEALGLTDVVINGWSLGGAVATEAASRLGPRCRGLILTCGASPRYTQAEGFPHGGTADDVRATVASIRPNRAAFFHGISKVVCAQPVGEPTEDWMWSIFLQSGPGADRSLLELATLDQRDMIAGLQVPVLAIGGSADVFTPPGIGQDAADLARDGTFILFEGCGHAPMLEDYGRYCTELGQFLDRIAH